MPTKLLIAALLLGSAAAAAPAPFPWAQGYLDPGRSFAQPLLYTQDYQKAGPPAQGWSRMPLPVMVGSIWPVQPLDFGKAELLPGVPEPRGQSWRVPVGLRLLGTLKRPAVLQLTGLARLSMTLVMHPGLSVPTIFQPGQEFLRTDFNVMYQQNGNVLDVPALAGRILTLQRLEGKKAIFNAEGLGEIERVGSSAQGFPDLSPLIADPDLAALKRKYEGKTVWGYGGLKTQCFPDANGSVGKGVPMTQGVTVRRVARLGKPQFLNVQGGAGDDVGHGADALALTPLVFLLDATPFRSTGDLGFSSSGPAGEADSPPTPPDPDPANADLQRFMELASRPDLCGLDVPYALMDTWAAERVFSLTPPSKELLTLSRNLPPVGRGLTRWQYAWLNGFPSSTFGSLSELLTLPKWQYRNIPFAATVSFDQEGRVNDVQVPRLP
jgi:hypothetical protein